MRKLLLGLCIASLLGACGPTPAPGSADTPAARVAEPPAAAAENPYRPQPGEAPTPIKVSTCVVSGSFVHLYNALDADLFAKYGLACVDDLQRTGFLDRLWEE